MATQNLSEWRGKDLVDRDGEVKDAPDMDTDGELSQDEEAGLFRHYGLEYPAMPTESGRRLARR
jgi:hypothetical protein